MSTSAAQLIFDALIQQEKRVVIYDTDEFLTAADLLSQSASVAAALIEHGVRSGARIVLCLNSNADTILGILAAWRLGAAPLVLDFRTPAAERMRICQTLAANLLVESRRSPGIESIAVAKWDSAWREKPASTSNHAGEGFDGAAPAFFNVSSGTTGSPKIYVFRQSEMAARLIARADSLAGVAGTFLTPMSMSFMATQHPLFSHMLRGGTVRFVPVLFSVQQLIDALLTSGADTTALPPTVVRKMLHAVGPRSAPLFPRIKRLQSIGGPAEPEDKVAAYRYLTNGYAIAYSSNLTGRVSLLAGEDVAKRPETSGRVLDGVTVDILDSNSGEPLSLGEIGLIRVRSSHVATEVIGENAERYGPGWGIPGDLGQLDADGFLTIVGRDSDMILRGGVNVAPEEIEAILRGHPDVVDVAVAGVKDIDLGQEIVAAIVARNGTVKDFERYCAAQISSEKRPRKFSLVKALPYNEHGKLRRAEVARIFFLDPNRESS